MEEFAEYVFLNLDDEMLINTGMQKMIVYKCEKYGKEKCKIIWLIKVYLLKT